MVSIVHCLPFYLILVIFLHFKPKKIILTHPKNYCEKIGPNNSLEFETQIITNFLQKVLKSCQNIKIFLIF
jgi:hypothetical protein